MAFLEIADFCSIEEYTDNVQSRAVEAELKPNDLYTLMMRLEDERLEAAKAAVIIERVSKKSGIIAVQFAFVDEDLQPESSATEQISDGLIRNFEDSVFIDEEVGREFNIREGYFRDYFEDQFGGFLAENQLLSAGA